MAAGFEQYDTSFSGSNKVPWHKAGITIDGTLNANEALVKSGLNWTTSKVPAFAQLLVEKFDADNIGTVVSEYVEIPGSFFIVRDDIPESDPMRVMGMVAGRYTPIQNSEAFQIADELVGTGKAQFDSAGSLKNGKQVWMLVKLEGSINVKDDKVDKYLLVSNSHDGSKALECCITPIRVVCMNTLRWALSTAKTKFRIRHTKNALDKVAEARRVLFEADKAFNEVDTQLNKLADTKVNPAFVTTYLEHLFPSKDDDKITTRTQNMRDRVKELFTTAQDGVNQVATKGTAYGLLNAVTQYIERDRTIRNTGTNVNIAAARLDSVWFGSGDAFRDEATSLLLDNLEVAGYGSSLDHVRTSETPHLDMMEN